jgi:outer membrane protein W
MNRVILTAAFLLGGVALAAAQTVSAVNPQMAAPQPGPVGFNAGDFAVRVAYSSMTPLVANRHVNGIGGSVGVTTGYMPDVDLSYFITDNISVQGIATATRHGNIRRQHDSDAKARRPDRSWQYLRAAARDRRAVPFFAACRHRRLCRRGYRPAVAVRQQPERDRIGGVPLVSKLSLSNTVGPVFNIGWN